VILPNYSSKINPSPILFRGIGQTFDDNNILIVKILTGNPSTHSSIPTTEISSYPISTGSDTVLVSGIQGRNNARVVISGSLDMFSNEYLRAKLSNGDIVGNKEFLYAVIQWNFGLTGILRFLNITHHLSDGTPPDVILHEKERPDLPLTLYPDPEITRNSLVYRIKDEIIYSMIVQIYDPLTRSWKPFSADDMQMEFVMLDPYVRQTMSSDPKTGRFYTKFTAPDNYGVFKFRVLYRRQGYSTLHAETQVSIRPFKQKEYERFIFSAYPYYASSISALIAFIIFSIAYLFSSDD
jgi:oligosaccharyltransferase complex subunit beta